MVAGLSPDGKFVEIVELPDHPWFLGCQFHPEYKSKPTEPHPLFVSYIAAALAHHEHKREREAMGEDPVGDTVAAVTGRPLEPAAVRSAAGDGSGNGGRRGAGERGGGRGMSRAVERRAGGHGRRRRPADPARAVRTASSWRRACVSAAGRRCR